MGDLTLAAAAGGAPPAQEQSSSLSHLPAFVLLDHLAAGR